MAEQLPSTERSEKRRTKGKEKWKHDWYSYQEYQNVHQRHIENLINEGIVTRDALTFGEKRDCDELESVNVKGHIECVNGVVVFVDKWLQVRRNRQGRHEVRGYSYSYHACLPDGHQILRYDSAHGLGSLHRHEFSLKTGTETSNTAIKLDDLPSLDSIIREAAHMTAQL